MPSRHRDRRGRGIRGPLARANHYTDRPVSVPRAPQRSELFDDVVVESIERVRRHSADVVDQIDIGIEDVPPPQAPWAGDDVPLAAAIDQTPTTRSQVVIYRRPIEHRAISRRGLRILVHRTLVEQLSALTGRSISELDPTGFSAHDD